MKVILRFLGAITIGSASLTSISACSKILAWTPPQADTEFAILLGWYSDDNITKIEPKLHYNAQANIYEIITNNEIITNTNFKERLLISKDNDFIAKNDQAASLLWKLGFTSGGVETQYNGKDVDDISKLTAAIEGINYGKIIASSSDYQIASGTMKVSVKLNNKTLKTYHLDILNNNLNIPHFATQLVNSNTITLNKSCGFANGLLASNCTLNLNSDNKQREWTALLNFLFATPSLSWTDSSMSHLEYFTTVPTFLQVSFGKVIVVNSFDCGEPQ